MILALYRTLLVRHFSLSGHWCFLIQLHVLAILSFWGLIIFLLCVLVVFHVGHAAAAYFKVVFIEQFVKFVVSREVYYIHLLEPNYFSLTLFGILIFVVSRFLVC